MSFLLFHKIPGALTHSGTLNYLPKHISKPKINYFLESDNKVLMLILGLLAVLVTLGLLFVDLTSTLTKKAQAQMSRTDTIRNSKQVQFPQDSGSLHTI